MGIRRLFVEHPASVNETYLEHMGVATSFGSRMIVAGVACMIHGLLPFLFLTTGSRTVTGTPRAHGHPPGSQPRSVPCGGGGRRRRIGEP